MWSDKKIVNILVNILIVLTAMYFLNYSQLCLPLICLILFIDNKFKFRVNNLKIFILLVLFGIFYFIALRSYGLYATIGLFLPMAYYIGSNLKECNEENVKKVIYLIALGMAIHLCLNFAYDFSFYGFDTFVEHLHYDIWIQGKGSKTAIATNMVFPCALIYYLVVYEKNKTIRNIGISLFILILIYNISTGRRTPVLVLGVVLALSIFLDNFWLNKNKKIPKAIIICVALIFAFFIFVLLAAKFDLFGLQATLSKISIIDKFLWMGISSERMEYTISCLQMAPEHLWGGYEISDIIGQHIHIVWLDVYDSGGIISFILFMIYSVYCLMVLIKVYKNNNISNPSKMLYVVMSVGIFIQMCLEPVISGSSIFLLCSVLFVTLIEGLNLNDKKN